MTQEKFSVEKSNIVLGRFQVWSESTQVTSGLDFMQIKVWKVWIVSI